VPLGRGMLPKHLEHLGRFDGCFGVQASKPSVSMGASARKGRHKCPIRMHPEKR
jgi:hypothetical protein